MLSSGALAIWFTFLPLPGQYVLSSWELRNEGMLTGRVPSTLLGPEEAAASFRATDLNGLGPCGANAPNGPLSRPYLENCIVNASI